MNGHPCIGDFDNGVASIRSDHYVRSTFISQMDHRDTKFVCAEEVLREAEIMVPFPMAQVAISGSGTEAGLPGPLNVSKEWWVFTCMRGPKARIGRTKIVRNFIETATFQQ